MLGIAGKATSVIGILCVVVVWPAWADAPADHVVLVSVDGFRPDFYLDAGWPAPTIQKMAREGAHAERVRVVFPSVTYPAHTTMVTPSKLVEMVQSSSPKLAQVLQTTSCNLPLLRPRPTPVIFSNSPWTQQLQVALPLRVLESLLINHKIQEIQF